MEPGVRNVGVRAAVHALDAALAEHRRATALAAGARERERMARARAVKAAAAAADAALEQPVERPMRGLRLAETWIEVERVRHALTRAVGAELGEGELRVAGDGWSARLVVAPGEGPAAAAREAVERIEAAATAAVEAARARLRRVAVALREHADACHAAASALAAADREVAERHADRARADACVAELAERLGPRRLDESPEAEAARSQLEQARLYLDAPAEQPHAWIAGWPPQVAGAILRDLPDDRGSEPALRRLVGELREDEPLLALAGTAEGVAAATPDRVLVADAARVTVRGPHEVVVGTGHGPRGDEALAPLAERRPGRLAEIVELVRAAGRGAVPAAPSDDVIELLHRLGDLRDRGVLSEDEFAAKKAELLRRI